uniref:SAM domain-containing protein n=1 Tax=Clastoptera arizonana TaxID=38151 RepID=A0A1B6D5S8_9HEMI
MANHGIVAAESFSSHQMYKAQPLTLGEVNRGPDVSPIQRSDQLNGYSSQGQVSTGAVPRTPAHSTPEADGNSNKAFPTRTYNTIKDMISSRFNKRTDTPQKSDDMSPQSQLRQHGVYLASTQQQNRAINQTPSTSAATMSSAEVMRRNQEIRQQLERERREVDDGGFQEAISRNYHGGSKHSIIDIETPRRPPTETQYQSRENETRATGEEMTPGGSRKITPRDSTPGMSRHMDSRSLPQSDLRPGETYSRTPMTSQHQVYYQDVGGYGVTGTRKSLTDAENSRRAEAEAMRRSADMDVIKRSHKREDDPENSRTTAENERCAVEENRLSYQGNYVLGNQRSTNAQITPRSSNEDRMQSLGVYVSRTPVPVVKTLDSRTPDINRSRGEDYNRKSSQSNERLNVTSESVSADQFSANGNDIHQKLHSSLADNFKSKDDYVREDLDDDDGGFAKGGTVSDYEKLRGGGQSDSGRGSTVYSSGKAKTERQVDTSPEPHHTNHAPSDSQWVDIVESELRQILDPKLQHNIANSTMSESISSMTPPLPPLSPGGSSDDLSPTYKHKSLPYGSKLEYSAKSRSNTGPGRGMWSARVNSKDKSSHHRLQKRDGPNSKMPSTLLCSSLDLDSMLEEENNSSDELSTTIDNSDTRAIRKQLEGLESMYSEVLKLLGVKKQFGRYQPSDPRINKRRLYGSMSSLPSSVSSRPMRDKRRHDERKKVKDLKGINKRFQRLESHVVTLARSVAHLSSEMRTQHLMIQEMEVIRGELAALRAQSNMAAARSQSSHRTVNKLSVEQTNSTPDRVKKLTKFFGDEPPLLRLFLKKLGYEKYASLFENERIGLVELPYMTEERLHKLGIPLGPRLRIMQEAQLGFASHENTLCIV